ncbi:glucose-fructose oxidoreductase domain-containing protein 2 isoform X2 [Panthera tigris]|uniref:glucose-fructose oxidoreductase domain-containing protein 2 isoform X2 n=1 Tax=Panthera tigris TaxID=9694 RepID=UPI001C6F9893|nr:glucose-fructose oxidoreductase domain-containing protein 2 isoform X2 [Panthera tigris]
MRSPQSRHLPAQAHPSSRSMRRLLAVPPLPFQSSRFLRNQAARSRWLRFRFRGPRVPASLPLGGRVVVETGPDPWSLVQRGTGDASMPGIGKNVVCEKAATSVDAFRMVTASRYYPQLMSLVGNVLRFLPAFVRMKQLIAEHYVGAVMICDARIYSGSLLSPNYGWICDELMGGGGLHTMGTYIVDLLTHLTGQRAEKVHGLLKTFVRQNAAIRGIRHVTSDDFCFFQMLMGGGVCSTVTLNFNMPGAFVHEVMVVGSAGRLVARGADLYGQKNSATQEELLLRDSLAVGAGLPEQGPQDVPLLYLKGMVYMVQALRQSFQGQGDRRTWDHIPVSMAASFEDGLYMQSVVDAIKRSSRSGEWEAVEVMTEEPDANQNLCEALQRNNLSGLPWIHHGLVGIFPCDRIPGVLQGKVFSQETRLKTSLTSRLP